jgi:hypothetical protein
MAENKGQLKQSITMELIDKDKRDGYTYDPIIKQYDTTFWKTTTGTPAISSNLLRLNASAIASYLQHIYADVQFSISVPTTPSAGEAKHWGLRNPSSDNLGAIYFEISGATFSCVSKDDSGNSETTTLTWSSYENTQTVFRIIWEPGQIIFQINGTTVATHSSKVPNHALVLRVVNADADNTDIAYIAVRRAAAIV